MGFSFVSAGFGVSLGFGMDFTLVVMVGVDPWGFRVALLCLSGVVF
jgi:hypothetical protein